MKKPFGLRLSEEGLFLLGALAKKLGVSQASAVEMAIRHTAESYGVGAEVRRDALITEFYGQHPWMRLIEAYVKPLASVLVEDVLRDAIAKPLAEHKIEDRRSVAFCLRKLGWDDAGKTGVWSPPAAPPEKP